MLFKKQLLTSKSYPLPVICVGNLAVGGTGKTPHTEHIVQLLQDEGLHVATLSRGYKRKTKGYVKASVGSQASQIGDEPWQLKHNFPQTTVAVCESRCQGIERLMEEQHPRIEAIILDDAFQHRYVKAGLNILLTDYHRLYPYDKLLPAGRLRECASEAERAQMVVVTKCPEYMEEKDFEAVKAQLHLLPHQQLFFSAIAYKELVPVFKQAKPLTDGIDGETQVLVVAGIAHPEPMVAYLKGLTPHVEVMAYPDHHRFTASDIMTISQQFERLTAKRLIVTTQKDAARLQDLSRMMDNDLKNNLYALPIGIRILRNQQETFNRNIIDYVRQDSRNR